MLKIIVDDHQTSVETHSSFAGLCAELGQVTHSIYTSLAASDPEIAQQFRELMTAFMVDEDSPCWTAPMPKGAKSQTIIVQEEQ